MFWIQTKHTIYQLKNTPSTMQALKAMNVYLRHSQLETIKTKVIGTLFKSHSFYTQREDATEELKQRILATKGESSYPYSGLSIPSPPHLI